MIVGEAWSWPLSGAARATFGVALTAIVVTLAVASMTGSYRLAQATAALGCCGIAALDALVLTYVLSNDLTAVWPLALAIPAAWPGLSWHSAPPCPQ